MRSTSWRRSATTSSTTQSYGDTQFDFTQNVIAMKNAGVKVLFIDQMAEVYASALLKDLVQQNFHPMVVLGAATYSHAADPGRRRGGGGQRLLLRPERLALPGWGPGRHPGGGHLPPLGQRGLPGFKTDLFTLYGWLSGQLFAQALKNAGSDPSRGSILKALSKITSFNGGNIVTTSNPAARTTSNCYLVGPGAQRRSGPARTIRPSTARPTGTGATTRT